MVFLFHLEATFVHSLFPFVVPVLLLFIVLLSVAPWSLEVETGAVYILHS